MAAGSIVLHARVKELQVQIYVIRVALVSLVFKVRPRSWGLLGPVVRSTCVGVVASLVLPGYYIQSV
eukprot:3348634-Amphidinium_carterae.7